MHIVFIDAQIDLKQPFLYRKISALQDNTYTTHSMSPQALLQVYRQIYNMNEPDSYLLTIDADEFELGTSVSQRSKYGIEQALDFIQHKVLV
jgi:Ni,Fe-hydrogenase maturation factor